MRDQNTQSTIRPDSNQERRAFVRMPFEHSLKWQEADSEGGEGTLSDVGRTGLCISLSRYLRPGRKVSVFFEDIMYKGRMITIPARLVWSRAKFDSDTFMAGLQILHGDPETLGAVSEIFYAALQDGSQGFGNVPVMEAIEETGVDRNPSETACCSCEF